jgi:dTDP-glucose pyrophosphorylase
MLERVASVGVVPGLPISEALARLQQAGTGILLVLTEERRLYGVLTDGDIRRHILAGGSLDQPCERITNRTPVVAGPEVTPADALELMNRGREFVLNHLPLVTSDGTVAGLWLRSDLPVWDASMPSAVIMAGGMGTRLRPLTDSVPKPMLPVGDRPLLERTLERLRNAGVRDVRVTTHYLGDRISSHFGNGQDFGLQITYLTEERPLGTAGALSQLRNAKQPLLVINGDILTGVDFQALLAFHREHRADATVGVRKFELQVPYGVLDCTGIEVISVREKPIQQFLVNAGIYLLQPSVLEYVPDGERFDMTDLVQRLLDAHRPVVSFPIVEYWIDVGQHADYEQAQADVRNGLLDH